MNNLQERQDMTHKNPSEFSEEADSFLNWYPRGISSENKEQYHKRDVEVKADLPRYILPIEEKRNLTLDSLTALTLTALTITGFYLVNKKI